MRAKGLKGVVGVFPQFGVGVPGGNVEREVEDDLIMFLRKQTLEDGYAALQTLQLSIRTTTLNIVDPLGEYLRNLSL